MSETLGLTINELRNNIVAQQIIELDARGGTRYVEKIQSHFGVKSADARLQRSEFLGGIHYPLGVQQVPQTSASTENNALAELGAYGQSNIKGRLFKKSFTEHGFIIIMTTIRYVHTYQQGIHKQFLRKEPLDFYDPIMANIGEQPIKNIEIFAQGKSQDLETFGYQEA